VGIFRRWCARKRGEGAGSGQVPEPSVISPGIPACFLPIQKDTVMSAFMICKCYRAKVVVGVSGQRVAEGGTAKDTSNWGRIGKTTLLVDIPRILDPCDPQILATCPIALLLLLATRHHRI
jgi:hypothetical protein